jgi:hypothetical protein
MKSIVVHDEQVADRDDHSATKVILFLFVVLFFLGYERSLYGITYPVGNLGLVVLLIVFLFFQSNRNKIDASFVYLSIFFFGALALSFFKTDVLGIQKYIVLLMIWVGIFIYITPSVINSLQVYFSYISFYIFLFFLPLYFFGSSYVIKDLRFAGPLFDPNYMGAIGGAAFLYFFILSKSRYKFIYSAVCGIAVIATFSKGALIATVFCMAYYYFVRQNLTRLVLFIFMVVLFNSYLLEAFLWFLSEHDLYRTSMGLNLRDIYFNLAVEGVHENPLLGNSISSIGGVINYYGYGNTSFHNYYLESLYINGVIVFVFLSIYICVSFLKVFKASFSRSVLYLFYLIIANNFSISISGVGILSVMFTLSSLSWMVTDENC